MRATGVDLVVKQVAVQVEACPLADVGIQDLPTVNVSEQPVSYPMKLYVT